MAQYDNFCSQSFPAAVPQCVENYYLLGLTPATQYIVIGEDKFSNRIILVNPVTSDVNGGILFPIPSFYDSITGGGLKVSIYEKADFDAKGALCSPVNLTICTIVYDSLFLTFYNNALFETRHKILCPCVSAPDTVVSTCPTCYEITVPSCVDSYYLAGFTPGDVYLVVGTDKRGRKHLLNLTTTEVNGDGQLEFAVPTGYDSPTGGGMKIEVYDGEDFSTNEGMCTPVTLTICEVPYTCIQLTFGNNVLNQTTAHVVCFCDGDITPPVEEVRTIYFSNSIFAPSGVLFGPDVDIQTEYSGLAGTVFFGDSWIFWIAVPEGELPPDDWFMIDLGDPFTQIPVTWNEGDEFTVGVTRCFESSYTVPDAASWQLYHLGTAFGQAEMIPHLFYDNAGLQDAFAAYVRTVFGTAAVGTISVTGNDVTMSITVTYVLVNNVASFNLVDPDQNDVVNEIACP